MPVFDLSDSTQKPTTWTPTPKPDAFQQEVRSPEDGDARRVIVTDIDMTMGAMCRFMVKWSIAAVPALIIIAFLWFVIFALLTVAFH